MGNPQAKLGNDRDCKDKNRAENQTANQPLKNALCYCSSGNVGDIVPTHDVLKIQRRNPSVDAVGYCTKQATAND